MRGDYADAASHVKPARRPLESRGWVHAATSLTALYSADIRLAGLWPSPAAHVSVEESGRIRAPVMEW